MSDYFDQNGKPITFEQWTKLFRDTEGRRVGKTELPGGVVVSTVWLGMNHQFGNGPPLIFETMVFAADGTSLESWRHATLEEAVAGHARAVAMHGDA